MLYIKDKEYRKIVRNILRNNDFKKLYNIEHHGISRLEHLLKVSYYSYVIAKKLKFDYKSVARGGILHDFYLDGDERNNKKKFLDTFIHPQKALSMSHKTFKINKIEEDIIISHMFPIYPKIPKYKESILINIIDKCIGSLEMGKEYYSKLKYKFNYSFIFILLFFIN